MTDDNLIGIRCIAAAATAAALYHASPVFILRRRKNDNDSADVTLTVKVFESLASLFDEARSPFELRPNRDEH